MARNCMPSLHVAWALLVWFNCKPFSRIVRSSAFAFVLITLVDTLGTGEHYLIDLVVAFPFAVAVQALCARNLSWRSKAAPVAAGFAFCLLWPVLLRTSPHIFLLNPVIPWTSILLTLTISAFLMKHVLNAESRTVDVSLSETRALGAGA
jgi:hypothetical protein